MWISTWVYKVPCTCVSSSMWSSKLSQCIYICAWSCTFSVRPKSPTCQLIWATECLLHVHIHPWNLRKHSFLQSPQQFSVWYVFRPCPERTVGGVFTECCDYDWPYSNLQCVAHFPINVISQWFMQSSLGDLEESPASQKSAITHQTMG